MSDEYLWDRTGSDPDVERIERLMEPYALKRDAPPAPAAISWRRIALAAVAAAVLVSVVSLAVRIERPGQPETLDFGDLATVTLEPGTHVRVLQRSDDLIRLRLDRGTINAIVSAFARPRLFQVETPSTTCVDLGCHYTLSVDETGRSLVRVLSGRVAFVEGTREVYVPRDASCRAVPGRGAGTPVFDSADPEFAKAVRAFDEAPDERRVEAARAIAALAQLPATDSLSLWHFLQDTDPAVVEIGADALIRVRGLPPDVTREDTLRRDARALEAWKDHLGWRW